MVSPSPRQTIMLRLPAPTDPGEQHDIARDHPDIVARLKARFDRVAGEFSSPSKR
jgi:hypothetical protein